MSGATGGSAEGERLLALTGLGPTLVPVAFRADEALSEAYSVVVEAVSTDAAIDPDSILHKPACLTVNRQHSGKRYFHGMVRSFAGSGRPVRGRWAYTIEIVPRLWFLSQTTDCRIFQKDSVAEIVEKICREISQTVSLKISGGKKKHDYITQYNETDLDFLRRLMEGEGYHFHFEHTTGDHTLVVTDSNSGFPSSTGTTMHVVHEGGGVDVFADWRKALATTHGKVTLLDYDPANPSTKPTGNQATTLGTNAAAQREVFHWPALHLASGDVTGRARTMIEAAEAAVALRDAVGENHLLTAGSRFTLAKDPFTGAASVEHVVRRVSHAGRDDHWVNSAAVAVYDNRVSAFPSSVPWRDKLVTPRPVMAGVFAGIVLGDSGDDIHTDELGRVKIQMFFDHREETSVDKAVWARVMQPWAGNSWGWQHLPRVGTEVAVCFMDGDPDRPVVMGGFYNGNMKPVFPIPGEQNKSGFRSRSTKSKDDSSKFSEWSFDDTKGSEKVFLHAEKDHTVEVEHDESVTIDNDQMLLVKNNRTHTVEQRETIAIDNGQSVTIKNGRTAEISTGDESLDVKLGNITIKADLGSISIEAMQSIELKVLNNSIKIGPKGITINGMTVTVKGELLTEVKGKMITVTGDAMLKAGGAITMIG